jgi:hypothetical protein
VVLVRKRTIPTERPPLSCEVSVLTFADRGCRVVSTTDPHSRIFGFIDPEPLLFHSSSCSLILTRLSGPRPDPLLLTKSDNAGNRTRVLWICSQEFWPLDHRGGRRTQIIYYKCGYWQLYLRLCTNSAARLCKSKYTISHTNYLGWKSISTDVKYYTLKYVYRFAIFGI